ncbi:MAG: hypothetical protein WCR05_11510, partial [Sphaerochaetaceae bacterium]
PAGSGAVLLEMAENEELFQDLRIFGTAPFLFPWVYGRFGWQSSFRIVGLCAVSGASCIGGCC